MSELHVASRRVKLWIHLTGASASELAALSRALFGTQTVVVPGPLKRARAFARNGGILRYSANCRVSRHSRRHPNCALDNPGFG